MAIWSQNHKYIVFVIVSIIAAIPYIFALNYPFQYDDVPTIFESQNMGSIEDIKDVRLSERPVRKISLIIDRVLFDDNVIFYRLHNTLLFILCLIFTGMLIYHITDSLLFALMGIIIFAFHPIHASTMLIVTHRKEMYLYIFSLITIISHMKGRNVLAVLSFILAILSKETAIVIPFILLTHDYIFHRNIKKYYFAVYAALLAGGIGMMMAGRGGFYLPGTSGSMDEFLTFNRLFRDIPYINIIFIQPYLFIMYILKMIIPINLSVDYYVPIEKGFTLLTGIMAVLSAVYLYIMYILRKNRIVLFAMLSFIIAYIPLSNIIPVLNLLSDRYMFFPSLFFVLALYPIYRRIKVKYAFIILPIIYLVLLINYIPVFASEFALWEYTVSKNPRSVVGNNNLGLEYYKKGSYRDALKYYNRALEYDSLYVNAYINRGTLYASSNELDIAKCDFMMAVELEPFNIKALYNLGLVHLRQGEFGRTRDIMEEIITISPGSGQAWNNLGVYYYRTGLVSEQMMSTMLSAYIYPFAGIMSIEIMENYTIADSIFATAIAQSGESELLLKNLERVRIKTGKGE